MANAVGNVPTTRAAIASPALTLPPTFDTFLKAWVNPKSAFAPPLQAAGGGYATLLDNFEDKWQSGKIPDSQLESQLNTLDQNIDNQLTQGTAP